MSSALMIDLETLSTRREGKIISIGALFFDPKDKLGGVKKLTKKTFYRNIDSNAYPDKYDFHTCPNTIKWWRKQDEAAKEVLEEDKVPPAQAIEELIEFIKSETMGEGIWANSPAFDLSMLEYHCHQLGFKTPWHFNLERDVRTLRKVAKSLGIDIDYNYGDKHNALHDCIAQAKMVQNFYRRVRVK